MLWLWPDSEGKDRRERKSYAVLRLKKVGRLNSATYLWLYKQQFV